MEDGLRLIWGKGEVHRMEWRGGLGLEVGEELGAMDIVAQEGDQGAEVTA